MLVNNENEERPDIEERQEKKDPTPIQTK